MPQKTITEAANMIANKYNPIITFLHGLFTDYSLSADVRNLAIKTRDKVEAMRDYEILKYRGVM